MTTAHDSTWAQGILPYLGLATGYEDATVEHGTATQASITITRNSAARCTRNSSGSSEHQFPFCFFLTKEGGLEEA
eukprot:445369-Amphidinium_carterae.2